MTSFIYGFWCESIKFEVQVEDSETFRDLHFGPFYQKETRYRDAPGGRYMVQESSCVDWTTDSNTDGSLKAVRAFSIMAPAIGGLMLIVLWLGPCWRSRLFERYWRIIGLIYVLLVTSLQGLTFLFFSSNGCSDNPVVALIEEDFQRDDLYDSDCQWDQGSTANVFSTFLWFAAGATMLVLGKPNPPPPSPPETQTITYEQTTMPDGTTTVEKVDVVKGTAVPPAKV